MGDLYIFAEFQISVECAHAIISRARRPRRSETFLGLDVPENVYAVVFCRNLPM